MISVPFAFVAQWWHTLLGMFSGHLSLTFYDDRNRLTMIACSCGRVFWRAKANA